MCSVADIYRFCVLFFGLFIFVCVQGSCFLLSCFREVLEARKGRHERAVTIGTSILPEEGCGLGDVLLRDVQGVLTPWTCQPAQRIILSPPLSLCSTLFLTLCSVCEMANSSRRHMLRGPPAVACRDRALKVLCVI